MPYIIIRFFLCICSHRTIMTDITWIERIYFKIKTTAIKLTLSKFNRRPELVNEDVCFNKLEDVVEFFCFVFCTTFYDGCVF